MTGQTEFDERFDDSVLDPAVWTTSYLPAWSSRAAAAAAYSVEGDGLHITIPADHPLWCPDLHPTPLRVSAVQTGNWSGPLGSTQGQQPFRDGLVVREEQPTVLGYTPHHGHVEVTCSARIPPWSMFSAWMVGIEDKPDRCGEICLVEVFGDTLDGERATVGSGIHRFRDPELVEQFSAEPMTLNVARPRRYAIDWRPGRVEFFVDGERTRVCAQAPGYPLQLILGVFDFPDRRPAGDLTIPELVVHRVHGTG